MFSTLGAKDASRTSQKASVQTIWEYVRKRGPVFLTPLACPNATPWYDLQSHPVSLRPALITQTFHWEKTFLRLYKKEEVHLA